MNRREFLKISCSGLITLYLSGYVLNMNGPCVHKDDIETEAIQKFYIMTVPVQQVLVVTLYFTSIMMTQQPLHFIK